MAADPTPGDDPLPTDVPTLHAMVRGLRAELAATRAELAEVKAKLDRLLAVTFRRSERAKRSRTPPPDADRPPRPRHRHGRSPLPDHLERRVVIHDLSDAEKPCPCCGAARTRIGEQVAEQLDCDPIRFFVRRTVRVSYACRVVFVDETWASTAMTRSRGRSPRGVPLVCPVPQAHWKTTTFVAALRAGGLTAPTVVDGAMTGDLFVAYVEQQLAPTLRAGTWW